MINDIFAQSNSEIRLYNDKSVYLVGEKACFLIYFPSTVSFGTKVDVTFYSYGPNNRGCTNGCTQTVTVGLGATSVCTDPFVFEDIGSWKVYITSPYGSSNEVNYRIENQLSTSTPISNTETSGQLIFTANNATELEVEVGNSIRYYWWTDLQGEITSWYTADGPDKCPGGISYAGEIKPWIASNGGVYTIQECQKGRTYTITVAVKNNEGKIVSSSSVKIKVKGESEKPSFCSLIQEGKTYSIEELRSILYPYFEKEYASCKLQMSSIRGDLSKIKYYSPSGDPTGIPSGNLYKADQYSIINGKRQKIASGTVVLCSYSDQQLAMFIGSGWVGEYCLPNSNKGINIDYCLSWDINLAIPSKIKSLCGKSINITEYSLFSSTTSLITFPTTSQIISTTSKITLPTTSQIISTTSVLEVQTTSLDRLIWFLKKLFQTYLQKYQDQRGVSFVVSTSTLTNIPPCNLDILMPIYYGQKGLIVKNAQSCLIKAGYNISVKELGYYGPQTKAAVKKFYADWYGEWPGNRLGPKGVQKLKSILTERPES